jgi:hypothetical protein
MVTGVGPDGVGLTYGAHLHTGPCVEGAPTAAGPHYNQTVMDGVTPTVVSDKTEVWLDFTVRQSGFGASVALVPFTPQPGDRSLVIHAQPTDDHGTAGPRLACLPVSW